MNDKTEEIRQTISEINDELPNGWTTGIGQGGEECYTDWYYHDNWEIEMYSDPGQPHTVNIYEVEGENEHGDIIVSEYPTDTNFFEQEKDARQWAYGLMEEYQ